MQKNKNLFSEPLHVTISVLFSILILALGLVLSVYSHRRTTEIVMDATRKLFNEFTLEIVHNFNTTYSPVIQAVSLLTYTDTIGRNISLIRSETIVLFADVLRHSPSLAGLQIGYKSGDYFILRPLRSERERELFSADEDASYVADSVIVDPEGDGTSMLHRVYYNRKLERIATDEPVATGYDPRKRPWYIKALETPEVISTAPYSFYFLHRMGLTIARQVPGGASVVAADVTLTEIAKTISRKGFARNEEKVLLTRGGQVLAYQGPEQAEEHHKQGMEGFGLRDLGSPVMRFIGENMDLDHKALSFRFQGKEWIGMVADIDIGHDIRPRLLLVAPADEILAESWKLSRDTFLLTLIILLVAIPITWLISKKISVSIRRLANEARRVSRFDFDSPIAIHSRITEVCELAGSMRTVNETVSRFLDLVSSIAGEQDFETTLERITRETMAISRADGVIAYLVDDTGKRLVPDVIMPPDGERKYSGLPEVPLEVWFREQSKEFIAITPETVHRYGIDPGLFNVEILSALPIPLVDRQGEEIGLLVLLYRDPASKGVLDDRLSFVRAFSGFAAVSLETRHLIKQQKQLLDSFIALLAGAIDTKSSYTGGHCQRVPVITEMLARSACASDDPPFADFDLSREEWEELHLAAWLHDCGKVTTPEYVVDKATKLETIYNRIHEIRTRFEVLKRDAEIRFWRQVSEGGNREILQKGLQQELHALDDDFAFVARCNLGSEFMDPEHRKRLQAIAQRTWVRTLDDRLGISWQEARRKKSEVAHKLPVREYLLADKPEHCIPRPENEQINADNPWGFKLDVPEYLYNFGEVYNLSVQRGTLTAEERFKINDHIVQTIRMLSQLPFPRTLGRVTEIAGCHHERMNGTGYPRRLKGEQMSLTARMMAIADIFEALTASDRPYKKTKKLSEAVRILFFMKKEGHIDPQLFDLFLTSGVYLQYAEQYLRPEQVDAVDIKEFLG
jgi:HD-GYP domain-containing protein (c-di-GMP phosphodiesterase class II)/HAMP domain-containing protein